MSLIQTLIWLVGLPKFGFEKGSSVWDSVELPMGDRPIQPLTDGELRFRGCCPKRCKAFLRFTGVGLLSAGA